MVLTALLVLLSWGILSAFLFILTFIFYLAVTKLHEALKSGSLQQVHQSVRWTGYVILFIGLLLDTMLNWMFLSVTFLELPHECLATDRVKRHKYKTDGWRHAQAIWWCRNWLAPFDNTHCDA